MNKILNTNTNNVVPSDPRDLLTQDQILLQWQELKNALAQAKANEIDMRQYIVKRAFPQANEGTNTQELGNGYQLKAGVKFNYKLDADKKRVALVCKVIAAIGNEGPFIQERLIEWEPSFCLKEYRVLQQQAEDGNSTAIAILKEINSVLVITDAAPTLDIKEPKKK